MRNIRPLWVSSSAYVLWLVGLGFSSSVEAADTRPGLGWQDVGKVLRLHAGHGQVGFLFTTETQISVTACPVNSEGYVFPDHSASNRNYATLLTAYSMGKPVGIYVTGGCDSGTGRPIVNAVQIHDIPNF